MMAAPTLLDPDLLARFEALLNAKRITVVEHLAPGLSDAQIDEIIGPPDLQLPEEVRVWWRWHNGAPRERPGSHCDIVPRREPLSLEAAVRDYERLGFAGSLLRPVSEKPHTLVECRRSGNVPAPIHYDRHDDWQLEVALPSFGELVLAWMSHIERGVYEVDLAGGWAQWRSEPIPDDVLEQGVY